MKSLTVCTQCHMTFRNQCDCSDASVGWKILELGLVLSAMVALMLEVQLQLLLMGSYSGGKVEHGFW